MSPAELRFEFPNNIGGVLNGIGESHGHVFHLCFGWQRNGSSFKAYYFWGVLIRSGLSSSPPLKSMPFSSIAHGNLHDTMG